MRNKAASAGYFSQPPFKQSYSLEPYQPIY